LKRWSGDQWGTGRIHVYVWVWIVLWTVTVVGLLASDIKHIRRASLDMALAEARIQLNWDEATRLWSASHGGVYVPVTETTSPNPNLGDVPERDIESPSGKKLTLMNPAYVLREMMAHYSNAYGIYGHITSLNHFRDETAPDNWERNCLSAFRRGVKEVWDVCNIEKAQYLRYMRPIHVEAGCFKCHADLGHKAGEVGGGVSVSIPMAGYLKRQVEENLAHTVSFFIIWITGISVIGFTARGLIRRTKERDRAEEQLRNTEKELRAVSTRLLNSWEEERKRIAIEVHEGLAQTMSAIKYRVESALTCMPERATSKVAGLLEPVIAIVQEGVSDIRRMASRLRPIMLDDMGILPTIVWLCREVTKAHPSLQIERTLAIEEGQIPEHLKVVIYRILESGLGLVAEAGHRGSVEISLEDEKGRIHLTIQTDGDMFAPSRCVPEDRTETNPSLSTITELAILSGGSQLAMPGEKGGSVLHVSWLLEDRS
jgi:hypothetical protein